MKLSKKHHYLPQFYLRGFTDIDGKFYLYDKLTKKIKTASPGLIFFENDKNTIKYKGQKNDIIERHYSEIEQHFSKLFNLLVKTDNAHHLLDNHGIYLLKLHLAYQFWRLPQCDEFSEKYLNSLTFSELKKICQITIPPLNHKETFQLLQEDEGFRRYFRAFALPPATFNLFKSGISKKCWHISEVEKGSDWENIICGDSPFIFKKVTNFFDFSENMIYPISKKKLLIITSEELERADVSTLCSTYISIITLLQSQRYVVCTNRHYLEEIVRFSNDFSSAGDISYLINNVFNSLHIN